MSLNAALVAVEGTVSVSVVDELLVNQSIISRF